MSFPSAQTPPAQTSGKHRTPLASRPARRAGNGDLPMTMLVVCLLSGPLAAAVIQPPVEATITPTSTTDLWDVSNGCLIVDTYRSSYGGGAITPVAGYALSNMFGTAIGGWAGTIFGPEGSGAGTGTVYRIDFSTPAEHAIRSFLIDAAHDNNADARGISRMQLFAYDSGTAGFIEIYDLQLDLGPAGQYDPAGVLSSNRNLLNYRANVDQVVTTNLWRAEFTQYGYAFSNNSTPRIVELDGFGEFIPEPAAAVMVLLAGPALILLRSRGRDGFG